VTAQNANGINERWQRLNRSEPCQISEDETWGIEYERGTEGTVRVCDLHEYSLTVNASRTGFAWLLPIGSFEPHELRGDHRYHLQKRNTTVKWQFRMPGGTNDWYIKVVFRHGEARKIITKIWAIMRSEDAYSQYHKTLVTPLHWQMQQTTIVHDINDLMCERDTYYAHQRSLNLNQRPRNLIDMYRSMRVIEHRYPGKCERKYDSSRGCPKKVQLAWCKKATGPLEVTLQRRTVIPDIHDNASILAYGQPCFLHNNYTRNHKGIYQREKRFFLSLLFSAIVGGVVEASLKSALEQQMEKYNQILNQRLEALAQKMNDGLNRLEGQITKLH